jgi:hypothetical protein
MGDAAGGAGLIAGRGPGEDGTPEGLGGSDGESNGGQGDGCGASGGSQSVPGENGGSSTQGEAGASPTLSNLPLPAQCQAIRGSDTDLLCSLDFTCGKVSDAISCYHTASAAWQCTCGAPNANRTYLIDGATGLDACAVGAGLCSAPPPALDVGSCLATRDELGTNVQPGSGNYKTCALDLTCQTPVAVDFASGVQAKLLGGGSARCSEAFVEAPRPPRLRVDCEASGGGQSRSYAVIATGVEKTCRPVLDSFLSSQEVVFDGPNSCVVESSQFDASNCGLTERCFDSMALNGDVSLVQDPLENSINCGFDSAGTFGCVCGFESATQDPDAPHRDVFAFEVGPASRPAQCDLSRCSPDMKAEPTGTGDCQEPTIEDYGDSCKAFFPCSRPVTFRGRTMSLYWQMDALCARGADQSFYCGCAVGNESSVFQVEDASTSLEACSMVGSGCLSRMTLPVEPASGAPLPPNPLP